jgi:hypothetical protein
MKLFVSGPPQSESYKKLTAALSGSDISIVSESDDFDFALSLFDPLTKYTADIALSKGKYFPDTGFIDKLSLEAKCLASGVPVLPAVELSLEALAGSSHPYFIIKPKVWSGGKHSLEWVYRIFSQAEKQRVLDLIGSHADLQSFILQKALIDPATNETTLVFVDGVVNGMGQIHFNSVSKKSMKNPDGLDSYITYKSSVRLVSAEDQYGLKQKITTLLQDNNIRNTPFKVQAIVDEASNTCYINDWSWGILPYVQLRILDSSYLRSHLYFAYDLAPTVTKPIDKIIVMQHIAFPKEVWSLTVDEFEAQYVTLAQSCGVKLAEQSQQKSMGAIQPTESAYYVLFGVACDNADIGKACLADFQSKVNA